MNWPNSVKCAVALSFEYDAQSVEWGFKSSIIGENDIGEFSVKFGIPRILELLDKHDIKGTFFIPGWDAERNPESVEQIANAGHEIAAHGYIHEDFSKLSPTEEKEVFDKSHKILTDITGNAPRGFRAAAYNRPISTNTLQFANALGYIYDSSFMDDDFPYQLRIGELPVSMIEIPWAWALNDLVFIGPVYGTHMGYILPQRTPKWVYELWREEFASLYENVGFFTLVIHPRDMGRGSRMPILDNLITHIKAHDVWFAKYCEIAEICLEQISR